MSGQRFGRLIVVKRVEDYIFDSGRKERQWLCKCDCGNEIVVLGNNLRKENTVSCGRYRKEINKKLQTKHGLCNDSIYIVYRNMKNRCFDPRDKRFKNYGERGITVCKEWLGEDGFNNFVEWSNKSGYSKGLTLDRIDVDGNYEPSNCRWTDLVTQENNRTNNRLLTYNNRTMTMAMWAKELNINYNTLANRIYLGWADEKALTKPIMERRKK